MPEPASRTTYLVTGATGNIGSRVVERLLRRGERPRVLVRDAAKAARRYGDRVDVRVGDFDDSASLSAAVDGVDVVFLVTAGADLAEKDKRAADVAKSAGVRLLVKLSTDDVAHGVGTGVWHREGEAAIRDSGVGFVFVQPSGFMDNFLNWADAIKADGLIRCAAGEGVIPFIHCDDIADVAIAAMTEPHYAGQSLPVTGPEALSFADMTAKVGAAIGRELRFEPRSEDDERRAQAAWGSPQAMIEARLSIFRAMRDGRLTAVSDNVTKILGREPISFDRWAHQNTAAFV
ncbi:SDR family oxidoreductase [Mycobacterium sp.]|uniref:SDR family oxidoreductase n=1 Tax=Mycobacterium sp. TaxID=1785 RepID=UPI003C75CF8F